MKTILIATDFSAASRNAGLYAAAFARAFNARLILFNAYQQLPIPVTEVPAIITTDDRGKLVQEQLEMEVNAINKWSAVIIETACHEGGSTASILEAAKANKADMIITGMKGSGKGIRKLMGSTVTALIEKTTIPLIVVPEEAQFTRIDTIALANEKDIEPDADLHVLDSLREIAELFQPKLYLVRVAETSFKEIFEVFNRPFKLTKTIRTLNPVYECIKGKDIPQALNKFIEDYRINMLAMLPHKHSLLEKVFIKSITRSMVFKIHIPLLILPALPGKKIAHNP